MRFAKAFFSGLKGRGALRGAVRRAIGAQNATGREHGFHAGKAGVDRSLQRGKAGGIKWSPRAAVGQMLGGGALHHTHPKGHGRLSPQDLRSVVTSPNSKGGRNTLWAHSSDGSEAARLTRNAAGQHPKVRAKAFSQAYRATKAPGISPYNHGRALRSELKRRGLIHSGSTVRKLRAAIAKAEGVLMSKLIETDEVVEKRGLLPRGGSSLLARRLGRQGARLQAKGGDPKESKRFAALSTLATRKRGNSIGLGYVPGRGYKSLRRTGIYKSLTALDTAIEKARGMIPRGGSSLLARRLGRQGARLQAKGGDPKESKRFAALSTLATRKKGYSIGLGYVPEGGYKSLPRRGRYK